MAELDGIKLIPEEIDRLFVFELDQLVYLLVNNKVWSSKVTSRTIIENVHDEVSITKQHTQPFGRGGIFYSVHGEEYEEHLLFPSKADLLESM
jgi:hypothetical protein